MTITGPRPTLDATTEWVQQGKRLWAGWMHGRHIGTIEQGRRFTYISPDGTATHGFRTLTDAQQAHLPSGHALPDEPAPMTRTEQRLMAATTMAAFGTVVLLAAAALVVR